MSYLASAPTPRQLDIISDTALANGNTSALSTSAGVANTSALSTKPKQANTSALSTIAAIEQRRRFIGISHEKLCLMAGIELRNWHRLVRGDHVAKSSTLRKLNFALDAFAAGETKQERLSLCQAYLRSIMVQLAQRTGWDPDLMLAQDFSSENTNDAIWLQASRLRRCSVYLAVEGLMLSRASIGRAIGVSRQAIHKSVAAIEAERDRDADFNAMMSSMMLQVAGQRL